MLTIREVEKRIADFGARKRQLQDHLKLCERKMDVGEKVKTKNQIKELLEAQVRAETDRSILRQYERMKREPIFASETEGMLVSPSLAQLLNEQK